MYVHWRRPHLPIRFPEGTEKMYTFSKECENDPARTSFNTVKRKYLTVGTRRKTVFGVETDLNDSLVRTSKKLIIVETL